MNTAEYEALAARQLAVVRDCEWAVLAPLLAACAPGRCLEIGCRHAEWLRRARALGFDATGLDPAPEPTAPGDPAILRGVAEQIPLPDRSLDVVLVSNALYCFQDRRRAMGEIARVLRPGGSVFVLTSNAVMAVVRLLTKYGLESPRLLLRAAREGRADWLRAALLPPSMTPDCTSVWGELWTWRTGHWRSLLAGPFHVAAVYRTAFFTFPNYRLFVAPRRLGPLCSSVVLHGRLE